MKKAKPMLLLTYLQNVDGTSLNATEPTSHNMRQTPYTASPSILFRVDPPPFGTLNLLNISNPPPNDSKKTDKKPVGEFL